MRAVLGSSPSKVLFRAALPVCILSICAVLLAQHVSIDLLRSLPARLGDIEPWRWVAACALTLGSFAAVAQYDALAHRALRTGISTFKARVSGAVGIALGQTLGMGAVTGALVRWRMLRDLSLTGAAKVSAFVGASFVVCWALVTALTCLVLPAPTWLWWPSLTLLAAVPFLTVAMFLNPVIRLFGFDVHLPSLQISGKILAWTFADTVLAGAAMFVLLPVGTLDFASFFPLFLIALGSGLISNTPGGVGPFELVLLSAVPFTDPAPIVAAILGFRVVFYAIPAVCAAALLLRPFAATAPHVSRLRSPMRPGARSEVAVVAQNGGALTRLGTSILALWPTGQTLTLFADPVTGDTRRALSAFRKRAMQSGKVPVIYKCSARVAQTARATRWRVLHIADEAYVPTHSYDINTPRHRGLRRKLRSADKASVTLRIGLPLPAKAMEEVDANWQSLNGRARGGSMGRYCPEYISNQWVACAYVGARLVAFVSVHRGRDEWCLDIMRNGEDAPDGTMHTLVNAAILAAKHAGAARISLAATPACPVPSSAFWRWAAMQVAARSGGRGLRQFKSSFAPVWVPRYAAARSWGGLALGLADIARAIHRPGPVTAPAVTQMPKELHNLDEDYEVASITAA
ncbi:MAG: phosphatidylglycerol lysyltransferase domain-containing protein [Pseudomonadota bacterium]